MDLGWSVHVNRQSGDQDVNVNVIFLYDLETL